MAEMVTSLFGGHIGNPRALAHQAASVFPCFRLARTAGAEGSGAPPWQESFTARLGALALLQTLNAELLSHDSAALTLDRWCAAHRLASPAHIVAEQVDGAFQAPTDEQRQLLGVSATEPVRYRRVRLICGDHVLSEADNWYVPARLTPEMNRLLDTTDTAFGRAVQTGRRPVQRGGRDLHRRRACLPRAALAIAVLEDQRFLQGCSIAYKRRRTLPNNRARSLD